MKPDTVRKIIQAELRYLNVPPSELKKIRLGITLKAKECITDNTTGKNLRLTVASFVDYFNSCYDHETGQQTMGEFRYL